MMKYIRLMVCLLLGLMSCADEPEMITTIQNAKAPEVSDPELVEVFASSITLKASLIKQNGLAIKEFGFCWSDSVTYSPLQNIRDNRFVKGEASDNNVFKGTINHLNDSTQYFVYAYAINAIDTAFSKTAGVFTTINGVGEVAVLSIDTTQLQATKVQVKGIFKNRGVGIDSYGFYWSTENRVPSEIDSVIYCKELLSELQDTFICELTTLKPLTRYYVRAFAENQFGQFAFNVDSFTTPDGKATLGKLAVDNIGFTSADVSAQLLDTGDAPVSVSGFCWSEADVPTLENAIDTLHAIEGNNGRFYGQITGLESAKKYYVRAFVINPFGITYTAESKVISTLCTEPNVITIPVTETDIKDGKAYVSGELQNGGESDAVSWGICWSTTKQPTIDNLVYKATDSLFTCELPNLKGNTTYYYCAFATNKSGLTGYGEIRSFTTPSIFTNLTVSGIENRFFSSAFNLYNRAFIVGGDLGESCSNELLSYGTNDSKWYSLSRYPVESGQMAVCTLNNNVYLMGGLSKSGKLNDMYVFQANANTWIEQSPMDPSPRFDAIGFAYRDSIYLLGGDEQTRKSKELWRYNPANQEWKIVTDAFPAGMKKGIALVANDRVYAGLGEGSGGKLWYATDSLTKWTPLSSIRLAVGEVSAAVYYKNEKWDSFFMINSQGKIWEYRLADDLWLEHSTFPQASNYHMFIIDDKLYILGQNLYNQSYFQCYDPIWDPAK